MMAGTVRDEGMSDERAWAAVLARDARLDGRLFYGVASTGVYCRPSCPSRRPLRRNARFFTLPAEAEKAGFRPCLRCDPRGDRVVTPPPSVEKARAYLDRHFDDAIALDALGREVGMSPHHLQRTFKRAYGLTPKEYQDVLRRQRLKSGLRGGGSVTTAIHDAGYGSASRVYERSNDRLGMSPGTYRDGGRGMSIRFAITACPLGRLLVAATGRGVCAVSLGEDDAALEQSLRAEFPSADVARGLDGLEQAVAVVTRYLAGEGTLDAVAADLRGTAFQERVWSALRTIPYGETRTYAQVAAEIGRPSAARAVARACATNRAALVVPCHRVVGVGGALSGYRWGVDRKRALLEQEARRKR